MKSVFSLLALLLLAAVIAFLAYSSLGQWSKGKQQENSVRVDLKNIESETNSYNNMINNNLK